MVKWVSIIVGALLVFLTIWFASPYTALRGIQQAVADNNADAVSEHIDYDVLRANMKLRVGGYMLETTAPSMPKLFKDLALSQASVVIDKAVDAYVTPETLKRVMEIKPVQGSNAKDAVAIQRTWDIQWRTERKGLNEIWLHVASTNSKYAGREVVVYLRRVSGITWKVVDIDPASWKEYAMQRVRSPFP